jgi:LCP family protein required for cell wall assembly
LKTRQNRPLRSIYQPFLLVIILAVFLSGCGAPLVAGMPVSAASLQGTPHATYVLAPVDATATPTPFQPLAPTPLPEQGAAAATPEPGAPVASQEPGATAAPAVTPTPQLSPTPQITLPAGGVPQEPALEGLPDQINIILLGADRRPWDRSYRTDTIILVTLNSDLGQVNLTSFPRDLYVTVPGFGTDRINTAWLRGGYDLLEQTFQHNFGITPDYHVLVDFSTFKKIIDQLGGLDVNVGEKVSDYRAGYWVTIPKGMVHMDADDVLWYVRTRKTTNDIARNRRQQEVLMAIFDKLVSMDALSRVPEFYDLYKENVKTDITLVDALKWLPFAVKIAETRNIKSFALTYNQFYDYITPGGAMVLVPNQQAMMKVIRKSQNLR